MAAAPTSSKTRRSSPSRRAMSWSIGIPIAADALPLPRHLDHWSPNSKALPCRRVLVHDNPKVWMPTVLRALEVAQKETTTDTARDLTKVGSNV